MDKQCAGLADQAVIKAAERFAAGDVKDQSMKFAPSGPEFIAEVRRVDEMLTLLARPRLPAPKYVPGPLPPYMIARQKALAANSHLPVLFENVGFDDWKKLSQNRQIPGGAKWVASLCTVYGPAPKSKAA